MQYASHFYTVIPYQVLPLYKNSTVYRLQFSVILQDIRSRFPQLMSAQNIL